MTPGKALPWVLALSLMGCSGLSQGPRVAWAGMTTCRHCNCLMPADVDPASRCAACHCGRPAYQCMMTTPSSQCRRRP